MSDHIKVIGSAGTSGFYPVPDGSSLSSGQAVVTADRSAYLKVIPGLPALPEDEEWYRVTESGAGPIDPTLPLDSSDQSSETDTQFYTAP